MTALEVIRIKKMFDTVFARLVSRAQAAIAMNTRISMLYCAMGSQIKRWIVVADIKGSEQLVWLSEFNCYRLSLMLIYPDSLICSILY